MNIYSSLTDYLIKKDYINEDDRDIYIYGFDICAYTIWSTSILLIIGSLFRDLQSTLIIVTLFYTFQSVGGGYHAKSHIRCLTGMICGLVAGLSLYFISDLVILLWSLMVIGLLLLLVFPLVLHPNKEFLWPCSHKLSIKSRIVTILVFAFICIACIHIPSLLYTFSASFFLSGLSRMAGKIAYSHKKICKNTDNESVFFGGYK